MFRHVRGFVERLYLPMRSVRTFPLILAIALTTSAFAAPKLVGAWKGHIDLKADLNSVPAQQRAMVSQVLGQIQKTTLSIELKANKTFVETVKSPMGPGPQTKEGTWSLNGNQIVTVATKLNGKPAPKGMPNETLIVSKDGKTLSIALPARGGVTGKITFTR